MNKDSSVCYEAELIMKCIRQKCLMCLELGIGDGVLCPDYTCPLWLFGGGGEIASEDLQAREEIHAEICGKIYAER